jgi:hypothetical protein
MKGSRYSDASIIDVPHCSVTLVRFSKHLKLEFRYLGARLLTFHRELTRGQTTE